MVKPQTKQHQTVLRGLLWVDFGKNVLRFELEICQTVYLRFGLGYIPIHTNPNREHP